jgi:hypothetical protein
MAPETLHCGRLTSLSVPVQNDDPWSVISTCQPTICQSLARRLGFLGAMRLCPYGVASSHGWRV